MESEGETVDQLELIERQGPWPFVSRWTYRRPDGSLHVRESRHRRKMASQADIAGSVLLRCLWMPGELNWWIAIIFAVGASLFMLGSMLALSPLLASLWPLDDISINAVFFIGSIPFTTAAYLQLYQAANAEVVPTPGARGARNARVWFGWQPGAIGWLSCALQFAGTLLFNINTFDAFLPNLNWLEQDLAIWGPDVVGSILFLASGYLAFSETRHGHWVWQPKSLAWWVTFANLLGCIAFMVSAVFAFVPASGSAPGMATLSIAFTLAGAFGFLAGSLLMLPETVLELSPVQK